MVEFLGQGQYAVTKVGGPLHHAQEFFLRIDIFIEGIFNIFLLRIGYGFVEHAASSVNKVFEIDVEYFRELHIRQGIDTDVSVFEFAVRAGGIAQFFAHIRLGYFQVFSYSP